MEQGSTMQHYLWSSVICLWFCCEELRVKPRLMNASSLLFPHPHRVMPRDLDKRQRTCLLISSIRHLGLAHLLTYPQSPLRPANLPRATPHLPQKPPSGTTTNAMPTPESALFLAKKPSVPPNFDGVDYADTPRLKAAQDAIIREQWVKSMMARLVREELGKCYYREGVNHLEKCGALRGMCLL